MSGSSHISAEGGPHKDGAADLALRARPAEAPGAVRSDLAPTPGQEDTRETRTVEVELAARPLPVEIP